MSCPLCGTEVRSYERYCVGCSHDAGCPNVRAAQAQLERDALLQRFGAEEESARARGCGEVLDRFWEAVKLSKAVMCRRYDEVVRLMTSDDELHVSFYRKRDSGERRPTDELADWLRLQADDLLFPHYREEISFLALTLDGRGPRKWGPCSLVFRDTMISGRTSVFEENSVWFFNRLALPFGEHPPLGHRAVWEDRHLLAVAKLASQLIPATQTEEFPKLLFSRSGTLEEDKFIEVHVFGLLSRHAIERIVLAPEESIDLDLLTSELRNMKLTDAQLSQMIEVTMYAQLLYIAKDPALSVTIEVDQ
jgi:hypothetical protein